MDAEPTDDFWVRITPAGIERSRSAWRDLARTARAGVRRALVITRAEMLALHWGKSLGAGWLVLEPMLLATMYWFVSAVLFEPADRNTFVAILAAIVGWMWFYRSVSGASVVLVGNASLLRNTEISAAFLLTVAVLKEAANMVFSLPGLVLFLLLFGYMPGVALVAFPFLLLVQFVVTTTLVMVLAMVGVFFKDLSTIVPQTVVVLLYTAPAIYKTEVVAERLPALASLLKLNPLYHLLPAWPAIWVENRIPDPLPLLVVTLACVPILTGGLMLFRWARYRFFLFL